MNKYITSQCNYTALKSANKKACSAPMNTVIGNKNNWRFSFNNFRVTRSNFSPDFSAVALDLILSYLYKINEHYYYKIKYLDNESYAYYRY